MNLTVKGTQEFLGKQIPVIEGGFGEGQRCILVKDVAEIHEMKVYKINELIKNNIDEFEEGVDLLEILDILAKDNQIAQELGISQDAINRANNMYLLSESGYILLCMLMKTEKAKEIRRQFRREYFAMRATLVEQEKYIKVLEERNKLLEKNMQLINENRTLQERINTACQIPRKQLTKDIRAFLNEYTKNAAFGAVYKDELFGVYLHSRRTRREQPTRSQFEDIVANEIRLRGDEDDWLDIVWK